VKKLFQGKKKFIVGPVLLLVVLGGAYQFVLAPKPKPAAKPKIDGTLVSLGDPFTVNLAGGHYGRVTVALLLTVPPPAPAAADAATAPAIPQEDAVRAIITDGLTGIDSSRLIDRASRHELLDELRQELKKSTDEPVKQVLFTDLAVQ
jgi:flagellar protein FliL